MESGEKETKARLPSRSSRKTWVDEEKDKGEIQVRKPVVKLV